MKVYNIVVAVACLLIICGAVAGEEPQRTLIMPPELVELAEKNGYTQIDYFYDSCYCYGPPFVYGSQDSVVSVSHMGAGFWCRKVADSAGEDDSYYLILASRLVTFSKLRIDAVVEMYYPCGGLSLYRDRLLTLDSFVYIDDRETPGPAGVKLKRAAYNVGCDGETYLYYKHEGRWLVQHTWDP